MKHNIKKFIRLIILSVFIFIVAFVPIVLVYVGSKKSGINLQAALSGKWTFEPFIRLFTGLDSPEINFREGLYRSVIYSTIIAFVSTFLALLYANWISGWTKKAAIGMSFLLLTLTLLPQTYLIMPTLTIIQKIPNRIPEVFTIMFIIFLGVLPLCAWMFYMMSEKRLNVLQENCALDRLGVFSSLKRITSELRVFLLLIFLLAWAVSWGNYFVPFSLGSKDSFTAVVQIATFTSNLGRDWSMICAAGFIVSSPSILIGILVGFFSLRNRDKVRS